MINLPELDEDGEELFDNENGGTTCQYCFITFRTDTDFLEHIDECENFNVNDDDY